MALERSGTDYLIKQDNSRYQWYALLLAMLTYGSIAGAARLCMPVLFPDIAADLNLDLVAMGTVWGMDPLAGVFLGLPSGMLIDRFGIKRTLTVVCIFAGIFGAIRGLAADFTTMSAYMFLFGLMAAVVPSITPKVTAVWFSGKRLALANGMLNVAWSLGAVIATLSSATLLAPLLGGWRNVLFVFGVPPFLLGLLWWFTGREPQRREDVSVIDSGAVPLRESLSNIIHIKNVWLLCFALMCYWGTNMGFSGYLPTYLRDIGWTAVRADTAMTLLSGFGALGVMPLVMLSNRIGSRKLVMLGTIIVMAITVGLIPFVNETGVWVLVVIGGLIRAVPAAIGNTMLFEMKEIGGKYAGTAIGLTTSLGMIGSFAAPPLGNSLEGSFGSGAPMLFWAALAVISIPIILMMKEPRKTK